MGDAVTRRALKPILLDKPELAAALSAPTWHQKIDVLKNSMSQELNASFGEDAVEKLLREIVAEAQKPASVSGEAQASAPLAMEAFHEVMAHLRQINIVNVDEDPANKEKTVPMEVSSADTPSTGSGEPPLPQQGEGQPSAGLPPNVEQRAETGQASPRTPTRPPAWAAPKAPGAAPTGEGQPSAKRTRVVEHTYGDGKTFVFDPEAEAPEIPCPVCFIMNPLCPSAAVTAGFRSTSRTRNP